MTRRREFIIQVSAGSAALLAGRFAMAADMVAETDAQAAALGYKADTSKVDAKKFPTHKASQNCGNCALFQGKAGDKAGMCPLFAGKQVAAAGWCNAYAAKG
jgi:formylmethanofuran:tetrahydromethanopterin formyltransferase